MRTWTSTRLIGGLLAALWLATACASDVGDIDRTDPNKILKADLKGIWFMDHTVIEAPVPSPVTFNGEQAFGSGASIIFDIQEDWLLVYPISELTVVGSEKDWKKAKIRNYWDKDKSNEFLEIYVGQPLAAYRILSHFDVQRDYNPQTGEQSNVISENESDRPWYEREYMRVDWSNNSIKDLMFLAGVKNSPVDYYVQEYEEDNPDRIYIGKNGINFVTKLFLEPVSPYACSVYDVAPYDCAGAVVKLRTSFRAKDPNDQYIPINYDNATYEDKFGFFMTSRHGYDVRKGIMYEDKVYFANRWDIWKNSRTNEPIIDKDTNTTHSCYLDSDCEGLSSGQVHCRVEDGWFSQGVCVTWDPLPFEKREPKPIVYHISGDWPKELWDVPYRTADVWSKTFKETVAWLKLYSEKGLYDVTYCKTDADCGGSTKPIFDIDMADTHSRFCTTDAECRTGIVASQQNLYSCGADGLCGKVTPCSDTKPCAVGQACYDGVCKECPDGACVQANQWSTVRAVTQDKGAFTLVYRQTKNGPVYDLCADDPVEFVETNEVQIQFYQLNAFVENVKLVDDGGSVCKADGGQDASYAFQGGVDLVRPYGCRLTVADPQVHNFKVVDSSNKTLAEFPSVTLTGGEVHTFVFGGDATTPLLAHAGMDWADFSKKGIRLAHMAQGEGSVDLAVAAGLRFSDVRAGQLTDYTGMTQVQNRVLVVAHGGSTELTCYHDMSGVGMCMGWRPEFTEADMARYNEILEGLPEMFVSCENQYTGDLCTDEQRGDLNLKNDCRNWHQDASGKWSNPCADVEDAKALKVHGDTRFNQFYWVSESQTASPLGYGPTSADPDSGHIYYGIANIYGADMVSYGQYAVDLLKASIGELSKENLSSGDYIQEFIKNRETKNASESLYAPLNVSRKELDRRKALKPATERFWLEPQERREIGVMFQDHQLARTMFDPKAFGEMAQASLPPSMGTEQLDARFAAVKGTRIESLLLNKEVQAAFANSEGTNLDEPLSADELASASPLEWASGEARRSFKDKATLCEQGGYFSQELVEPYLYGTAKRIQTWCADQNNWKTYTVPYTSQDDCMMWQITREMLYGTLEHEVGHTVGLRHNFIASSDAFNYQDSYYGKRTKDYRRCYLQGPDGCAFGDTCRITCTSSDDCKLPGTTCEDVTVDGKAMKACVDAHLTPTGVCWGRRTTRSECSVDGDCTDLGAGAKCDRKADQKTGYCAAPAKPVNGVCSAGLKVDGEICARQDSCNTTAGKCIVDGSRSCANDTDCKVVYQIHEVVDTEDKPVKMFVPRGGLYPEEVENGRNEVQYSSLMDYGGTINFDLQDIGKYDQAAIRFGYGELVDVYTDTSNLMPAMEKVGEYYGIDPIYVSSLMDSESFTALIFSAWLMLNDFIGVEQNFERLPVPFRKVVLERNALDSNDRGVWDMSYRRVPYKFRGDEWRGNWETYVFDVGADVGEIVDHSWNKLHEYYVFDAFKRERWGAFRNANPVGYYNRILDRWFPPLADAGRFFAIYYNVFRPWPSYRKQVLGDVMRLGYMKEIAEVSLKRLTELIFNPAPGSYKLVDAGQATERFANFDYNMGADGSELDVALGDGMYPYTTYWRDAGYYYFQNASFIGSFWEKVAALNTLTYSLGYFVGSYIGEQVPVGVATSIGFNTNYYTEMVNALGGFLVGNTDAYRPYVDADNVLRPVDPLHEWEAEGMPRVESAIEGESMKAYVGLFSYAYLPSGFDQGFQDAMYLCIKGTGNCYTIDETDVYGDDTGIEVLSFTDPWSKKTYVTKRTNYDTRRLSPAYWLVQKANAKLAEWENAADDSAEKELAEKDLRSIVENLDLILSFNELYGNMSY